MGRYEGGISGVSTYRIDRHGENVTWMNGKEVQRCPLRRALLRACVPDSLEDVSGCVYRDLVLGSEKPGEYVEI